MFGQQDPPHAGIIEEGIRKFEVIRYGRGPDESPIVRDEIYAHGVKFDGTTVAFFCMELVEVPTEEGPKLMETVSIIQLYREWIEVKQIVPVPDGMIIH